MIQALGEKVCEEEKKLVEEHKKGRIQGEREVPVLFEEADGVYVKLQGKDRKRSRQERGEIKVGIAYDGWKRTGGTAACFRSDRKNLYEKICQRLLDSNPVTQ